MLGNTRPTGAQAPIEADGIRPKARPRIYRNHTIVMLTEALKATLPVVCRLVGERFLVYATYEYLCETLPSRPCLVEHGDTYAFLYAVARGARLIDAGGTSLRCSIRQLFCSRKD